MHQQKNDNSSVDRRDVLVILGGDRAAQSLVQICAGARVSQTASARVGVVECPLRDIPRLQSTPGITVLTGGSDVPPEVRQSLDEGERLFIAAWLSRNQEESTQQRRGEGLSWDAPGYLPPDPPARPAESHEENQRDETERRDSNGG